MKNNNMLNMSKQSNQKVLLGLLPFWTPLIPPQGACQLKEYLQKNGYIVKTIDATVENEFYEIYCNYFNVLKEFIPENKRGNFFNIGHDVLRNHMMAHINCKSEEDYNELVKIIIEKNYFCYVDYNQVSELKKIISDFYTLLDNYIIALIEKEKPNVFGLTTYSGNLSASMYAFKLVKSKYPDIMTVMGGGIFSDQFPIGSPNLELFLKKTEDYLDKVIIGQGENLLLEVLEGQLPKEKRVCTIKDSINGSLELKDMGIPDYSDLNLKLYPMIGGFGSSSCPFQCSFCNVAAYWGKYKEKDISQTISEMKEIYIKYGKQLFFMTDSLVNPLISNFSKELVEEDTSLYWDAYLRVDKNSADIEKTTFWRKAGFYRARIGVESGSQKVLDLMGKKITTEQTKATVSSLAYAGIKTTTYWVIGHPGETEEDFQKTLNLLEEMKDDIWEAECNPFGYYYTGQANSDNWADKRMLVYPEKFTDILISQTWCLDVYPQREEIYSRVSRFVNKCNELGIPNPYTEQEIYQADARWKRLHKNAVPYMAEFSNKDSYVNENKNINKMFYAKDIEIDTEDFNF